MSKTLLILSGCPAAAETARRIKGLGHSLVVCDADPQAPGFAFADSCLIADIRAPADCAAAAERYNRKIRRIDGVLSLIDAPLTAAAITERLRLPGLPLHLAELADDRLRLKRGFASAGVASCWHAQIFTAQELQRAAIARDNLVLKPAERRGEEHRLAGAGDLAALFQTVQAASPTERVMIEQYPQPMTIAAFLDDGQVQAPAPWRDLISRAASALDLRDGPLTAQIAVEDSGATLVDASPHLAPDSEFLEAAIGFATGG